MRWILAGAFAGFLTTLAIVEPLVVVFRITPWVCVVIGLVVSTVLSNVGVYVAIRIEDRRETKRFREGLS